MSTSQLAIEYLPLAALRPYDRNARTHSPEQVAQLAASIRTFGWTNPILIDEADTVIAGHGRLSAATQLGLDLVPVIRLAGLSEQQRRALAIADNKLALNAGWNDQLLAAELQSLGELQGLVGFSNDELLRLLGGHAGLTDPDEVPQTPADPITQPGDVWQLGPHRLLCGDATNATDVAIALEGARPHLMVTDPPYGVNYDAEWRARAGLSAMVGPAHGRVQNDDRADWRAAWSLFPGAVAYVWHGGLHAAVVAASLDACRFHVRAQIVWVKTRPVVSRGHYHWQHEPVFYAAQDGAELEHGLIDYAVREGETGHWMGGRKQSTVWFIEHLKSDTGHSTQKPVECMRRPIENNSRAGDAVYDPFIGSGTTIIAAEMTERTCYALEISPAYCDVTVERWQNFTGRKAERIQARADAAA